MRSEMMPDNLEEERSIEEQSPAIIVRHAQSMDHTEPRASIHDEFGITMTMGEPQSAYLAKFWSKTPNIIIFSPYKRTWETAMPTCNRFYQVPRKISSIYEFTYLNPADYDYATADEKKYAIDAYWKKADPVYNDGGTTESFQQFWNRVGEFERNLEYYKVSRIFSHEQFINLMRFKSKFPQFPEPNPETMKQFRIFSENNKIAHTARLAIRKIHKGILTIDEPKISHLPPHLITF
jgi:broad specificity phosphatase PhoE